MMATENKQQEGFKVLAGATLRAMASDCSGATAIEYGLMLAILAFVVTSGASAVSGGMVDIFGRISAVLSGS